MKLLDLKDTTSKLMLVFVPDSSSSVGAGLTGLAWNTASLSWYYYREGAGTGATQVTLASMTIGTWASGGFVELDAVDMPGWYEIGIPNAAIATGANYVGMQLKGAANMAPVNLEIQLTGFDIGSATVTTDAASRTASKATGFATPTNVTDAHAITDAACATATGFATPTNITAGTITTVTNLTNAPTVGDLTATMKASVNTEADTALSDYDGPKKADVDAVLADTDELQTNQGNWLTATGFAVAGDEMNLADDAITADKYDQSTAYPHTSADSANASSITLNNITNSVDIFNLALGLIGEYEVTTTTTTTKQYRLCERFYTQAIRKAIGKHPWNEAIDTEIVIQESNAPLTEFAYQYEKPEDCLKVRSIGSDLSHWEVQGQYIVTDYYREPSIWATETDYVAGQYIQYESITYLCATSHTSDTWSGDTANWTTQSGDYKVIDVTYLKLLTDVTEMSAELIDIIAQQLAIMVATPLTGDPKIKAALIEEFEKVMLPQARSIDAVEGRLKNPFQSSWIRSRR